MDDDFRGPGVPSDGSSVYMLLVLSLVCVCALRGNNSTPLLLPKVASIIYTILFACVFVDGLYYLIVHVHLHNLQVWANQNAQAVLSSVGAAAATYLYWSLERRRSGCHRGELDRATRRSTSRTPAPATGPLAAMEGPTPSNALLAATPTTTSDRTPDAAPHARPTGLGQVRSPRDVSAAATVPPNRPETRRTLAWNPPRRSMSGRGQEPSEGRDSAKATGAKTRTWVEYSAGVSVPGGPAGLSGIDRSLGSILPPPMVPGGTAASDKAHSSISEPSAQVSEAPASSPVVGDEAAVVERATGPAKDRKGKAVTSRHSTGNAARGAIKKPRSTGLRSAASRLAVLARADGSSPPPASFVHHEDIEQATMDIEAVPSLQAPTQAITPPPPSQEATDIEAGESFVIEMSVHAPREVEMLDIQHESDEMVGVVTSAAVAEDSEMVESQPPTAEGGDAVGSLPDEDAVMAGVMTINSAPPSHAVMADAPLLNEAVPAHGFSNWANHDDEFDDAASIRSIHSSLFGSVLSDLLNMEAPGTVDPGHPQLSDLYEFSVLTDLFSVLSLDPPSLPPTPVWETMSPVTPSLEELDEWISMVLDTIPSPTRAEVPQAPPWSTDGMAWMQQQQQQVASPDQLAPIPQVLAPAPPALLPPAGGAQVPPPAPPVPMLPTPAVVANNPVPQRPVEVPMQPASRPIERKRRAESPPAAGPAVSGDDSSTAVEGEETAVAPQPAAAREAVQDDATIEKPPARRVRTEAGEEDQPSELAQWHALPRREKMTKISSYREDWSIKMVLWTMMDTDVFMRACQSPDFKAEAATICDQVGRTARFFQTESAVPLGWTRACKKDVEHLIGSMNSFVGFKSNSATFAPAKEVKEAITRLWRVLDER